MLDDELFASSFSLSFINLSLQAQVEYLAKKQNKTKQQQQQQQQKKTLLC